MSDFGVQLKNYHDEDSLRHNFVCAVRIAGTDRGLRLQDAETLYAHYRNGDIVLGMYDSLNFLRLINNLKRVPSASENQPQYLSVMDSAWTLAENFMTYLLVAVIFLLCYFVLNSFMQYLKS